MRFFIQLDALDSRQQSQLMHAIWVLSFPAHYFLLDGRFETILATIIYNLTPLHLIRTQSCLCGYFRVAIFQCILHNPDVFSLNIFPTLGIAT